VLALPDRVAVALGLLGVVAVLAAQVGQLRPLVVLPAAGLLVATTWRLVPGLADTPRDRGPRAVAAVVALLLVVAAWVAVGARFAAQYVVVNRDPGFLTLRALWLADHPSALVPVGSADRAATAVAGASAGTEAFWLQDGLLHAQGNTMLPALLGMQGWLGGERAVLAGNLMIGAVALLAVFAAARRFAGPLWALLPTAAMALSLPFLTFTRAAYTEPLTVALLCGGLAVAHGAFRAGRGAAGSHGLVGVLVGAVAAARIDGAVVVVGLALGYLVVGASPLGSHDRRAAVRSALAALAAAVAMTALGVLDVLRLSPEYVREHADQLTALLAAAGLVVVVVVVLLLVPSRVLRGPRLLALRRRHGLGDVAAGAVVALVLVLATRPLWWQGRAFDPASGLGYAVQVLQSAAGQPLDGARSYDEQTLAWVVWYLGLPAVVLGFVGLALLARRGVARRDPAVVVLVAVVAVAAVFPLVRPSITPDQIWAVRRLLPATIPGLLIAGTCALDALRGAPAVGRDRRRGWLGAGSTTLRRAVAAALAAAVVAFPLTTWRPGASVVELSGRATQAHAVCDALADLGVERVVWTHSSPFRYLATLRVLCDVEVVEVLEPPSSTDLAAIRRAWGDEPVAALSFDVTDYPWTEQPTSSVGGTASTTLGRTLVGVPRTVDTSWSEVWVGLVQPDGSVSPAVVQPAG
jgi:hypothetical protein